MADHDLKVSREVRKKNTKEGSGGRKQWEVESWSNGNTRYKDKKRMEMREGETVI